MLILELWDVMFLADRVGLHKDSGTRQVLFLRHTLGFSYAAIATELGCSENGAAGRVSRFWRQVREHPWTEGEKGYLRTVAAANERACDRELWDEAYALWALFRGVRTGSPPSPTYDELGRLVAARATVVTVADVYRLLCIRRHRAELQPVRVGGIHAAR